MYLVECKIEKLHYYVTMILGTVRKYLKTQLVNFPILFI